MKGKDLRIVYMGTPEFAVEGLKTLVEDGYKVVGVITVPDKPAGRGQKLSQSAVKTYAASQNIPVLQPEKLRNPEFLSELANLKPDLQIVVAFRMLPKDVWKLPQFGTFNLHASLLPQYRGAAPINWAVINGEKETGITTFLIDEQIDTGNILLQQKIAIDYYDNAGIVHDTLMTEGAKLIKQTVDGLAEGRIKAKPQNSATTEVPLKQAPKIFKDDCRIQWAQPSEQIYNKIRGLSPFPAAWTYISKLDDLTLLKIYEAEVVRSKPDVPGAIHTDGKTFLHVSTKDGWLKILSLQIAGKKRMSILEFLRGNNIEGQLL